MAKKSVRDILDKVAKQERELMESLFLAPCVQGGKVRVSMRGLVHTFTPDPADFEGWGVFMPMTEAVAGLEEEAELPVVSDYLKLFPAVPMLLVIGMRAQSWLAFPLNESDMKQRLGFAAPVPVHLVQSAAAFETVVARWDGASLWFDEIDRRADPIVAENMRAALVEGTAAAALAFSGMTPEMRTAYELATTEIHVLREAMTRRRNQRIEQERRQREAREDARWIERHRRELEANDEERIREALRMGGGNLGAFRDAGEHWTVEWTDREGQRHTSAISKDDLTVLAAGICLNGRERDFDLASLVGVYEDRPDWMHEWDLDE